MKRKRRYKFGEIEGADGEKWEGKITNRLSRVIDCWSEEKDGGMFVQRESTVGTGAETELQPSGQGEPCKEPVEIKILQPYCYQNSAHHAIHILFVDQTLAFHSSW